MGGVVFLCCYLFDMGCPALELAHLCMERGLSLEIEISGRALAVSSYVGPGGLWWPNVLNSALPPRRLRPDTRHQDPVSHTETTRKNLHLHRGWKFAEGWEFESSEQGQRSKHSKNCFSRCRLQITYPAITWLHLLLADPLSLPWGLTCVWLQEGVTCLCSSAFLDSSWQPHLDSTAPDYWFIIKGTTQEQPNGRDAQGKVCEASMLSPGCHPPTTST